MSCAQTSGPVYLMVLLATMVHISWGLTAYDCETPTSLNVTAVSMREIADCPSMATTYNETKVNVQVIQREDIKRIHVQTCLVNTKKIVYNCGFLGHISLISNGLSAGVYSLGAEGCRNVHSYQTMNFRGKTITGIKMNGTTNVNETIHGSVEMDGSCEGTSYYEDGQLFENVVTVMSIVIQTEDYWTNVDLETNEVHMLTGHKCSYRDGYCMDSTYGDTLWSYIPDQKCDDALSLVYDGPASMITSIDNKRYIVVEHDANVFALELLHNFILCALDIWQTEHPMIMVTMEDTSRLQGTMPRLVVNVNLVAFVNSKFLYTEQSYKRTLDRLYVDIVQHRCLIKREILQNKLLLAHIFPNAASSLIRNEPGLLGRLIGEVLYIMQCVPRTVSHRKTVQCYSDLPVTVDGKEMFVESHTHIIQAHSEEVNCKLPILPMFHLNDNWLVFAPYAAQVKPPTILEVEEEPRLSFDPIKSLGSHGLYSYENINEVQKVLTFGVQSDLVQRKTANRVVNASANHQGIKFSSLYDEGEMKILTASTVDRAWEGVTYVGSVASSLLVLVFLFELTKNLVKLLVCGRIYRSRMAGTENNSYGFWATLAIKMLYRKLGKEVRHKLEDTAFEMEECRGCNHNLHE